MGNPEEEEEEEEEAEPKKQVIEGRRGHKQNRVMEKIRHLLSTTQTSNPISINAHSKFHTPNHPPYALMIRMAIAELNEEGGSSEKAISKFIGSEYGVFPFLHDYFLRHHLRKLCGRRELVCVNDGHYILRVGKEGKKKKKKNKKKRRGRAMGKRMSKPSGVEGKDGEGTDTSVLELPMLSQHQDEPQLQEQIQGEEKQCQQRCPCPKRKRDMDMDLEADLPLDSHHHKDQPLKRRAQEMPSKLMSDTDAIMEVVPPSVVQDQNERKMQCQGQLPQRILRSHNQEPSVSESAAPTMTLSSKPSEHQDEKQQKATYQVLGKQERPRELKIGVEGQPPKRPGRGRPRKLKTELKEQQPKRPVRGRPPKLKPSGGTSVELCSSADVRNQKKQHQVAAMDGEETDGMEIEEVSLTLEQEIERQTEARGIRIEGNDEQKKWEEERQEVAAKVDEGEDENTEVIEEQSKSERQQLEVIKVRSEMIIIELSDEEVSCDEKQFVKENHEESEILNKEATEVGEGQNEVTEPQLGISSEENEPQPQQTEVIENQFQWVEIQNQQQQDREMELNRILISTSTLNKEDVEAGEGQDEVIEEQKLELKSEQNDSQPQQTGVVETQLQSSEGKRKSGQYKNMLYHKTRSASAPTATTPPVDPSGKGQVELEEPSELPINKGLKSAKKELSVPQQQENDQCPLQKRKLRSHNRPNMHELATDATILEPLKHRAQGTPPILGTDKDAIMQVVQPSEVQGQNEQEQQSQGQFSQRLLQSNDKKASVSEPAAPTMTLSSMPTEEQQQQAQHKVLEKQGRPRKLKTDVEEKPAKCRGQGRPHRPKTELEETPPTRPGRGRPPKPKPDTDEHQKTQHQSPAKGRGRPMKHNLNLKLKLMKSRGRGRPPKAKGRHNKGRNLEERPRPQGRGRPPKPKSDTDTVMVDPQNP